MADFVHRNDQCAHTCVWNLCLGAVRWFETNSIVKGDHDRVGKHRSRLLEVPLDPLDVLQDFRPLVAGNLGILATPHTRDGGEVVKSLAVDGEGVEGPVALENTKTGQSKLVLVRH